MTGSWSSQHLDITFVHLYMLDYPSNSLISIIQHSGIPFLVWARAALIRGSQSPFWRWQRPMPFDTASVLPQDQEQVPPHQICPPVPQGR